MTTTELERFVAADGRADLIEQVARQIEADGITYIYFQLSGSPAG